MCPPCLGEILRYENPLIIIIITSQDLVFMMLMSGSFVGSVADVQRANAAAQALHAEREVTAKTPGASHSNVATHFTDQQRRCMQGSHFSGISLISGESEVLFQGKLYSFSEKKTCSYINKSWQKVFFGGAPDCTKLISRLKHAMGSTHLQGKTLGRQQHP